MQRHLAHSALLCAALGALSACSSDPYHGPVVTGPSVTIINELEPNNSAATAVGIGPVGPFDDLVLTGWVSGFDGFGADGVDGWALQSNSPIRIDFALEEFSTYAEAQQRKKKETQSFAGRFLRTMGGEDDDLPPPPLVPLPPKVKRRTNRGAPALADGWHSDEERPTSREPKSLT